MIYYISGVGYGYASIKSDDDTLLSGDFKYPILSCMTHDKDIHVSNIIITSNKNDTNDFNDIKNEIVKNKILAGYVNVNLSYLSNIEDAIIGLYDYLNNSIGINDEVNIDLTYLNRYTRFSVISAAKHFVSNGIKCRLICIESKNIVVDKTHELLSNIHPLSSSVEFMKEIGLF